MTKSFSDLDRNLRDEIYEEYKAYKFFLDSYVDSRDEVVEEESCSSFVKAENNLVELVGKYLCDGEDSTYDKAYKVFKSIEGILYQMWMRDPDYMRIPFSKYEN